MIASTTDLGRWNAERVLEVLYDRRPYSNAELVRSTGLSRSTVERAVDLLVAQGVVAKSEPVALVSGRPAALYRLRPTFGYVLALDVGAHTVRARLDDLAGPQVEAGTFVGVGAPPEPVSIDPDAPAEGRLRVLTEIADRALEMAGVARPDVRAVTVGTPGIVDAAGVIKSCQVIRSGDWVGDRLRNLVRDRFPGARVSVDNDANLAVLGEQRFGVAGDAEDVVVVLAGRRVGFGIVHSGGLHRGAHHQAGEAANVDDSGWGRASRWLYEHDGELVGMFAAAAAGEPAAVTRVAQLADLLGRAMAEIVHTLDPELIVLGGAVALAGATILDPLRERFKAACQGMETPELALSALGRQAVLLGAAEHGRREVFAHLLDEALPQLPAATARWR
ncbi:ROK family transcriptional regulator [Actinocatenispora sera]|uniref:Transcriptional regulator n=1 Tax=Actinocatenispora sera TaxID=390989 RepID=A0A810KW11_9ACTN|nr:ROK family transcriptional regulator [Actinocatenispora sera]BCJ27403.1 transcriptional regulator [Actinocatenispora sera]